MPLYAYACPRCGYSTERFVSIVQRGATFYCPKCMTALCRQIATPALHGSENMPNG